MKKIVKIVAIVVAVVLVAAFVAPMLLRGKIAQIVKREANEMFDARVDFEKLDISLLRHFPRASLDLKGLTVVGAGPFEGDTIVAANRISVVVNPMSLFGDDGFEVTKVILAEPALHAHKLADGKVNWDIVKASGEEPAAGEVSSEEGSSSFSLSIRDFRISDATKTIRRACVFRRHPSPFACGATCRPTRPTSTRPTSTCGLRPVPCGWFRAEFRC